MKNTRETLSGLKVSLKGQKNLKVREMRPNGEICDIFMKTLTLLISESVSVVWELLLSN